MDQGLIAGKGSPFNHHRMVGAEDISVYSFNSFLGLFQAFQICARCCGRFFFVVMMSRGIDEIMKPETELNRPRQMHREWIGICFLQTLRYMFPVMVAPFALSIFGIQFTPNFSGGGFRGKE